MAARTLFRVLAHSVPPQTAELDLLAVAGRRVAGEQVQLGDRHIQYVFFVVLNAQVILGDPLHLHAADARIPADAVVLVDHQVPGRDVGQAGQGIFVPSGLFALGGGGLAEGTGGDEGVFGKGILAAGGKMSRQHLHQSRGGGCVRLFGDGKALVPQVPCQALGGTLGAGQHRDRIVLPDQRGQILVGQGGHLAAPGGQRVGGRVDNLGQAKVRHAAGKVLGAEGGICGCLRQHPARRGIQGIQPGAEHPVLQQAFELLVPAELGRPLGFPQRGRFLQNIDRLLKIVQDGGGLGIPHRDVLVHGDGQCPAVQHGQVRFHAGGHGGLFLSPLSGKVSPQQVGRVGRSAEQHLPGGLR